MNEDEPIVETQEAPQPTDAAAWERLKLVARLIGRQLAHEEHQRDRQVSPASSETSLD